MHNNENQKQMGASMQGTAISDGSSASYYRLPKHAGELQDLISYRNMNAQIGEIFRACYRYGQASRSDQLRDAKKIRSYADAEVSRLEKKYALSDPIVQLDQATDSAPKSDLRKLPVFYLLPNQSLPLSMLTAVSDTLRARFDNRISGQGCRLSLHEMLPNWSWRDIENLLQILYPNMERI